MKNESSKNKRTTWNISNSPKSGDAVYGFGFLGALLYFILNADTFWMAILGIFKAIVWPGILVYRALGL